jgi:murein DD-endopeptidase MepM/ murein hydrolase activator NlpD
LKRVFPSQVNSVHASEADVNADAALPHSALSDGNRRVSSSAATLGLALSVGISGLFAPTQTQSAVALEPEVARASASQSLTGLDVEKSPKLDVAAAPGIPVTAAIESQLHDEAHIPVIAPLEDVRVSAGETSKPELDQSGQSDLDSNFDSDLDNAAHPAQPKVSEWKQFDSEWNAQSETDVHVANEPMTRVMESEANADGEVNPVEGDAVPTIPALESVDSLTVAQNNIPNSTPATVYQVSEGDTVYEIANKYGISPKSIEKLNQLGDPSFLKVGQNLSVPTETQTIAWSESPAAPTPVYTTARIESGDGAIAPREVASTGMPDTADNAPMDWLALDPVQPSSAPQLASEPESTDPYVEELRADVSKLREKYRVQPNATVIPATPTVTEPIDSATVSTPETIARQAATLPAWAAPHAQAGIVESPKFAEKPASPTTPEDAQSPVAAVSTGQPAYISPVRVSPDLPALPGATAYLPKTPGHQQTPPEQEKFAGYVWPAEGELSSPYGWRWGRMHRGIDIAGPIGTPIVAAASGVVSYADWNDGGYGYLVEITHTDGSTTLYAHNDRILVNEGEVVEQGQQISEMGSTGFSTGPHLHFEVHAAGEGAVDPVAYLPQ